MKACFLAAGRGSRLGESDLPKPLWEIGLLPFASAALALWLAQALAKSILINLILAIFNMFPLPPLDGGRVAVGLLPRPLAMRLARLERFGMMIIIGVIFLLPMLGQALGIQLNLFQWLILTPVCGLSSIITFLAGLGTGGVC